MSEKWEYDVVRSAVHVETRDAIIEFRGLLSRILVEHDSKETASLFADLNKLLSIVHNDGFDEGASK